MRPQIALDPVDRPAAAKREAGICLPAPWIAGLRPYKRGTLREPAQGDRRRAVIKLDSNEAPGPPPHIIEELVEFLREPGAMNHYPDEECRALRQGLSAYVGQPARHIVPFCGADGALEAIARSFLIPGDEAVLVSPCYDQFRAFVELAGAQPRSITAGASPLQFDCASFLTSCRAVRSPKLIYLINPNSPAGYAIDEAAIIETLAAFPNSLVVVDETYMEFAPRLTSSIALVRRAKNLIVVRSFSKAFGLAGLRLGYAIAPPRIADVLEKVRNVKAVTSLAQAAGLAVLGSIDHYRRRVVDMQATRRWFVRALRTAGITAHDTHANFVLIETAAPPSVSAVLGQSGIRVRDLSWISGLEKFIRVTVTTRSEMGDVLNAVIVAIDRVEAAEAEIRSASVA
jgi:histidinol-phosphate aminotransferase